MIKKAVSVICILLMLSLSGCAYNPALMKNSGQSVWKDVTFQRVYLGDNGSINAPSNWKKELKKDDEAAFASSTWTPNDSQSSVFLYISAAANIPAPKGIDDYKSAFQELTKDDITLDKISTIELEKATVYRTKLRIQGDSQHICLAHLLYYDGCLMNIIVASPDEPDSDMQEFADSIINSIELYGNYSAPSISAGNTTPSSSVSSNTQETKSNSNAQTNSAPENSPSSSQQVENKQDTQITAGKNNALRQANRYLSHTAFSRKGLIKQLEFEGYSHEEAEYGADNTNANWKEQAVKKANNYISHTAFSRTGLIKQLEFEEFTHEEAEYGVNGITVDWKAQAAKKASQYLGHSSFSRKGLIDQLKFEGFTQEEAEYGVSQSGL